MVVGLLVIVLVEMGIIDILVFGCGVILLLVDIKVFGEVFVDFFNWFLVWCYLVEEVLVYVWEWLDGVMVVCLVWFYCELVGLKIVLDRWFIVVV